MSDEVDPAQLQAQLNQIQSAMGLQERYEGIVKQWLLFGVLVAVAAACSQYVHLQRLPGYYHAIVWLGLLFGGGSVGVWWLFRGEERPEFEDGATPNLWFVFGVTYFAVFPIQAIVAPYLTDLGYEAEAMLTLSLILVMIGVAYVLMGNTLRAYRIRAQDRWAFYVGGVMLLALSIAIHQVDALLTWGYAVFGGLYFVYAIATYVVLTRT